MKAKVILTNSFLVVVSAFIALLVILSGLTSCESKNVTKLKHEIEAVDKKCPINMGMMGDMLSLKYDENTKDVQLYFSLQDDILSIDALRDNEDMVLNSMKLSFSRGESKEMLKLMINAGAGLSITFKSASTGKTFKANLSLDDLKEILDNPMSDPEVNRLLLDNQLAMENARCPYTVEEGMQMVKAYDDGDNIVYACRIDEDLYDIELLQDAQSEIKNNISESFNDPVLNKEIGLIYSLGKGLTYRYQGESSGQSVDITFSNKELEQYAK